MSHRTYERRLVGEHWEAVGEVDEEEADKHRVHAAQDDLLTGTRRQQEGGQAEDDHH